MIGRREQAGLRSLRPIPSTENLALSPETLSRRTVAFVNLAHALDHFVLLIFPTAIIAIAAERGGSYAALIGLSTGAFVGCVRQVPQIGGGHEVGGADHAASRS